MKRCLLVLVIVAPLACTLGGRGMSEEDRCRASGGSWGSRGCDGTPYCSHDLPSGYPYRLDAAAVAPARCTLDLECPRAERCSGTGACVPDITRCQRDVDCPEGASCTDGSCECTSDDACGAGLTCRRAPDGAYLGEIGCVVCFDAGGSCRHPTCDSFGVCPGNLVCDRDTAACVLPTARQPCTAHDDCPRTMRCASDGFCLRVADASTEADASGDAADAPSESAAADAATD